MDDHQFHSLPSESRALAPMLWLLASEFAEGTISDTFAGIAFRLRMEQAVLRAAIEPLVKAGFFLLEEEDTDVASRVLADCKQVATPETETEAEKSREEKPLPQTREKTASVAADQGTPVFNLQLHGGQSYPVFQGMHLAFERSFPGIVVSEELVKAQTWLDCNPQRRPTPRGAKRFLFSWMNRAQNDASRYAGRTGGNHGSSGINRAQARTDSNIANARAAYAEMLEPDGHARGSAAGGP